MYRPANKSNAHGDRPCIPNRKVSFGSNTGTWSSVRGIYRKLVYTEGEAREGGRRDRASVKVVHGFS
jgi:hypothetical protein